MKDFIKSSDGSMVFFETVDMAPVANDESTIGAFLEFQEAAKSGGARKKLVKRIAAMHSGVTRNRTEYPVDELNNSVPTWTTPYRRPVIKNHGRPALFGSEYHVDDVIGLIDEAYIGKDMGVETLMFRVSIMDSDAQEKVMDGRYSTVSIGTKVKHAVCSICNNDWATGDCSHERGKYYLTDEENPDSAKMCTWIMGGLEGHEVSFVVAPSDSKAGVREHDDDGYEDIEEKDDQDTNTFSFEDVTTDDVSALEMLEAELSMAPPSEEVSDETSVPSEKEEDVDLENKQEEAVETDPTVDEIEETTSDPIDEGEVPEAEETKDDTAEDGPVSEEVSEDEGKEESDSDTTEEAEEVDDSEVAGEQDELLLENRELRTQVHALKAHLYIEAGYHRGFLTGDREALLAEFLTMKESTLDELLDKAMARYDKESVSEQIAGKVASPVLQTGDDAGANAERTSVVRVKTDKGEHVVKLHGDDGGKTIRITPKL